MRTSIGLFLLLPVLLAGCATRQELTQYTGHGPITLSPQMELAWEQRYLALGTPRAFAVSQDGKMAAWNGCPVKEQRVGNTNYVCEYTHMIVKAVTECQTKSNGAPCFLYGWVGKVVWKD